MTVVEADAYPLYWPDGWKRTPAHRREPSRYQVKLARARDELLRELRLLGARDVIISTNIELRRDGLPYANKSQPEHPGVAVYWMQKRQQRVIACDVWRKVEENLRAVGLTVAALRMIERAGASEILDRAFTGFNALPPAQKDEPEDPFWFCDVLELNNVRLDTEDIAEDIERAYKRLAAVRHPDKGGSTEAMSRLNNAREAALEKLT